jgi:hypothetical protein
MHCLGGVVAAAARYSALPSAELVQEAIYTYYIIIIIIIHNSSINNTNTNTSH